MKHRNDIYGDDLHAAATPAIPAATVVLVRDAPELQVLMLHKTSKIAFGGMWVFPGGRIDAADRHPDDPDDTAAARRAAVRETREETGLCTNPGDFVWFAHWTPPPATPRRFATWFFAAPVTQQQVRIDGGEIQDHRWLAPATALEQHGAGAIDLAPPTWVTLHQAARHRSATDLLHRLRNAPARFYETRLGKRADGTRVAMWQGDAGYATGDADAAGNRHRLVMQSGAFTFENTVVDD